ncbi:MAG: aminotransferase class V-fold PLP-dependent enzyme [Kiloniellaceae bacterium]|nr:aminotransferase class V-fold PLP-dependent enzyme [Kiloniellaceae bacterium]
MVRLWPRTRLQIGWRDLAAGAFACLAGGDRARLLRRAETYWPGDPSLLCFSVRSGFDLLLQALELQPGDEVVFSALNVKGMINIVRREGYVAVPLDFDAQTLTASVDTLQRALSPRSKVLVVAHLFGCRLALDGLIDAAHAAGLVVVEDCAQAFNGRSYSGHPRADVCMFSFGPLKTSTALGGALLNVRDAALREKMCAIQDRYPLQPTKRQARRVLQFAGLKLLTLPLVFGLVQRFFALTGRDYEDAVAERVRNVAVLKKSKNLRFRCSTALVALLCRRLARFDPASLTRRADKGRRLKELLSGSLALPGQANSHHDYWVFPAVVEEPHGFIAKLRRSGFDAANLPRSQAVAAPEDRPQLEPKAAAELLSKLVILPCYDGLPDRELQRLAKLVREAAPRPAAAPARAAE